MHSHLLEKYFIFWSLRLFRLLDNILYFFWGARSSTSTVWCVWSDYRDRYHLMTIDFYLSVSYIVYGLYGNPIRIFKHQAVAYTDVGGLLVLGCDSYYFWSSLYPEHQNYHYLGSCYNFFRLIFYIILHKCIICCWLDQNTIKI